MKLAYIDSCIYIARFEGIPSYQKVITEHLFALAQDGWIACISELVMLETLCKPLKTGQHALIEQYRHLFDALNLLKNYPDLFEDAQRIMQNEGLNVIDALHVSIAFHDHCQLFVTSDPHFRSLKTIRPYWIDLSDTAPPVGVIER